MSPGSPLKHRNLNMLGRYSFTAFRPTAPCPLRASDTPGIDEDEDRAED